MRCDFSMIISIVQYIDHTKIAFRRQYPPLDTREALIILVPSNIN
jgi:hypothetical protein